MSEQRLTTQLLQERTGAPQQVVSTWLNNTRGVGPTYLNKLAAVLNVTRGDIITHVGPNADSPEPTVDITPVPVEVLSEMRDLMARWEQTIERAERLAAGEAPERREEPLGRRQAR